MHHWCHLVTDASYSSIIQVFVKYYKLISYIFSIKKNQSIKVHYFLQANAESQKTIKRYQQQLKDVQTALEEEQRARDDARELLGISERRANALQNELEESRTLLEQADRGRRQAEQELSDAHEQLNELSAQNTSISAAKRKLESELQTLHVSNSCLFLGSLNFLILAL